jgi:GTP-binding protein
MGTMYTLFSGYAPLAGEVQTRTNGSLVAWEPGTTTTYALKNAEERGVLFLGAGVEVYEGMVVGERPKVGDLAINVCKKKHLTAMHTEVRGITIRLSPPRQMSLDEAIEYLAEDELLEVTPVTYRIRKRNLAVGATHRQDKRSQREEEEE